MYSLAGHEAMERSIIRYATVDEVKANPNFAHEKGASGALIDKVGYAPQGEKPDKDESRSSRMRGSTTSRTRRR